MLKILPRFSLILLIGFLLVVTSACAGIGKGLKTREAPPESSSVELESIKALAGKWRSTTSMFGKKDETVYTEFTVTAGGSAVLERIFPGTPQEMVSVYFDDDDGKLSMTHYCVLKNRPHFKLAQSSKDMLKLDVVKVEGIKSKETPSMGAMTLHFEDKDNFSSTCEGEENGKTEAHTMRYTRVR